MEIRGRRRAQHGADLRAEHLGLVEAHADRAPAEERIRFRWPAERRGEFVPAQVIRADHDRVPGKGLSHFLVVGRLLVLRGQRAVSGDEKLGPEESHSFGAVCLGGLDFVRQVNVAPQRDVHAIERERRLPDRFLEVGRHLPPPGLAPFGLRHFVGRGIEQHRAAGAVENHLRALLDAGDRAADAEDRRDADRVCEDRGVRGARALLADQTDDVLAVELHRQPR